MRTIKRTSCFVLALAFCTAPGFGPAPADAQASEGHSPAGLSGSEPRAGCLDTPGVQDEFFFTHQAAVFIEGERWYLQGPEHELNFTQEGQAQDLPGHCWQPGRDVGGLKRLIGKHYNTGPLGMGGMPGFWSSDAGDHVQLFWVDLVISKWTPRIAAERSREGYLHYHELILAGDGCFHPDLVAWMRHSAVRSFTFDGGPPQFREDGRPFRTRNVAHEVLPGIDWNYPPNYDIPYLPELLCSIE